MAQVKTAIKYNDLSVLIPQLKHYIFLVRLKYEMKEKHHRIICTSSHMHSLIIRILENQMRHLLYSRYLSSKEGEVRRP